MQNLNYLIIKLLNNKCVKNNMILKSHNNVSILEKF